MRAADYFLTDEGKKYLEVFRDKVFVIKYGGAALEEESMKRFFLEDVAELKRHGIDVVLIHGGGKMLSRKMQEHGLPVKFENGLRVTTPRIAELALEVFSQINKDICSILSEFGVRPLGLDKGKTVDAKIIDLKNTMNRVGQVVRVDSTRIDTDLIPVISSLGRSVGPPVDVIEQGSCLNINADLLAVSIALSLKARKLVYISDVNGVYLEHDKPETQISHVTETEIQSLIKDGTLHGGMRLKVETALSALNGGVNKVHFIDGRIQHSLMLEIFTDKGVGTEIVHDQ